MGVINWYRAERWLYLHHLTPLAAVIKAGIRIIWGGGNPLSNRDWIRNSDYLSRSWGCTK